MVKVDTGSEFDTNRERCRGGGDGVTVVTATDGNTI